MVAGGRRVDQHHQSVFISEVELAVSSDDSTLRIWNVRNGRLVVARQFDAAIQSLAFSKDGRYLYTGNGNTTCYRLEMQKLLED